MYYNNGTPDVFEFNYIIETSAVSAFLPPHIRAADDDHTPELYS